MNDTNSEQNHEKKVKSFGKKIQSFFTKIIIIIAIIFFGYLGYRYWQVQENKKIAAQAEVGKFDNVDSEIFDLADDYKSQAAEANNANDLPDVTVDEIKEKGAEFIYQMLLKNQVQINDLQVEVQVLKDEILKYKSQEKIGKMIFTYVDLRQRFFASENYDEALKNFEMLSALDNNLYTKITRLKSLLPQFLGEEKLSKAFQNIIPEIITTKNNKADTGIIAKIRRNISKLIIVRRIDERDASDVDGIIARTDRLLRERKYQEALSSVLVLDSDYHQVLKDFLNSLSVSVEVQDLDHEIVNYLKNLS